MTKTSRWLPCFAVAILVFLGALQLKRVAAPEERRSTQTTPAHSVSGHAADPNTAAIAKPSTTLTSIAQDALPKVDTNTVVIVRPEQINNLKFGTLWGKESHPSAAEFSTWANQLQTGLPVADAQTGVALAKERKTLMLDLIRNDPELALAYAIPFELRQALPEQVVAELETPVSGNGHFYRLAGLFENVPEGGSQWREAQVGASYFRSHTYGDRDKAPDHRETAIHGIAIGTELAVSDEAAREVGKAEAEFLAKQFESKTISGKCPTCEEMERLEQEDAKILAVTGRGVLTFSSRNHLNIFNRSQEAMIGIEPVLMASGANVPQGTSGLGNRPAVTHANGTNRTVLVIRVDFPDAPPPNANLTVSDIFNRFTDTNGIVSYFSNASYGRLLYNFSSNDVTPVLRMPQNASVYASGGLNGQLHSDARAAATAAGFDTTTYNHVCVLFTNLGRLPGSTITYGGLGQVPGRFFWQNGNMGRGVVSHEMGHNLGLGHANKWIPRDGSIIGPPADLALAPGDPDFSDVSLEYGDRFDIQGGASFPRGHYNHFYKNYLSWYSDDKVQTVTNSGTYRINLFDDRFSDIQPTLALKISRDPVREYWIGYRGLDPINASNNVNEGAYVLFGYTTGHRSTDLLVMNGPPSNAPPVGAALEIDQTFTDASAGVGLRTVAIGGAGVGQFLDIAIDLLPRIQFQEQNYHVEQHLASVDVIAERIYNNLGTVSGVFTTTDGTALAPSNYTATTGTVTWAELDVDPKPITIPIGTTVSVISNANFDVSFTNISGGVGIFCTNTTVTIHAPGSTEPFLFPGFFNNRAHRAIQQIDGSIVVGGDFSSIGGVSRGRVAMMDSRGALLTNFIASPGANSEVNAMDIQPDGKVLIGGEFTAVDGLPTHALIARMTTNGLVDTNFNVTMHPDGPEVRAVAVQPDGKIWVGGPFTSVAGLPYRYLARYQVDGSLDTNFAPIPFELGSFYSVQDIALAPNGQVYVAGIFTVGGTNFPTLTNMHSGVLRLNPDGRIDTSFNVRQGAHFATFPTFPVTVNAVHVKADGDVLIGGEFTGFNSNTVSLVARLHPDGSLDTNFVSALTGTAVVALDEQPDGKILVGGSFPFNYARLNADGSLDTGFWQGAGAAGLVRDIRYTPDHKILVAAEVGPVNESPRRVAKLYAGVTTRPGVVQFTTNRTTTIEGNTVVLTLTRTGGTDGPVSVNYGVFGGTHTNDLTGLTSSGTISWDAGESLPKSIVVPVAADSFAEADEDVYVAIGAPIGGVVIGTNDFVVVDVTDLPATPKILTHPVDVVANIGDTVTFTAFAIGGEPLSYFWRFNGRNVPGGNSPTLALTNVQPGSAGLYSVRVMNAQGFADSGSATLTVNVPPFITEQPQDQTVEAGANIALGVATGGNAPISFQWQRNGVNIPGATVPILNILNVAATNSGDYRVVVSNPYGSVTSSNAAVVVESLPVIVQQPGDRVVAEGGTATFTASALGSVPFSYQWTMDGTPIAGATNSSHTVTNATGQNTGNYAVTVTNSRGSSTSLPARLTVITEELTANWAFGGGGLFADAGNSVALDTSGNAIVVGSFTSVANIGGTNLTSNGRSDAFIAKFDPVGGLIWARGIGGDGFDSATDVVVDPAGNIHVIGSFEGIVDFVGQSITNSSVSSYSDIFVAEFDSSGALIWVRTIGRQFEQDRPGGIGLDAAGNVLVTGASMIDQFAGLPITNHGPILIAKYSSSGTELWAIKAGNPSSPRVAAAPGTAGSTIDSGRSVGIDANGNVYVATSMRALTGTFGGVTLTNTGGADIVVMKLDGNGNAQWVRQAGGPTDDEVFGIAVDFSGAVFITGDFTSNATFGSTTLTNASAFLSDIFVAKLDASGNWVWARKVGGTSADGGRDIAVNNNGSIALSGFFSGMVTFGTNLLTSVGGTLDAFAAQLDSDGMVVLVQQAGGSASLGDQGLGVTIDANGNIAMTGSFSGTGLVGARQLTSAGNTDLFTTRFQSAGLSTVTLSFVIQPGEIVLSWPNSATGYFLQTTTNTPADTNFSNVAGSPASSGTNFVFTNSATDTRRFFRLRKP